MPDFTDVPWSNPQANLSADDYCRVCLIDDNPPDTAKVKRLCHLPVRATPDSPVNKNALRNAAARLNQVQADSSSLADAKSKLIALMGAADIETSLAKADGEAFAPIDIIKAYPNEHAARQIDPAQFSRFARKQLAPGVTAIIGFPASGGSKVQSVRFDSAKFTQDEAKAWLKQHDFSAGSFEAAADGVAKVGPTLNAVHIPGIMALDEVDDDSTHHADCLCDACVANRQMQAVAKVAPIFKADTERRIAYAIVYQPDVVDRQGDLMTADQIEKMAHDFMVKSRNYDLQHLVDVPTGSAYVVESFITPTDFAWPLANGEIKTIRKGAWVVGTYFADEQLWKLVKGGQINAYSIFGVGKRRNIAAI